MSIVTIGQIEMCICSPNYNPLVKITILSSPIIVVYAGMLFARKDLELTLETAVEMAVNNSFQVKRLKLDIEKTMYKLKAERAGLKSKVFMQVTAPELRNMSDYKWNSTLYRDEIVRQNTVLWRSDLSIKQPVILLGYPTNGYVSLNHRLYRYQQRLDGESDIAYYNRLYLKFEQPFFIPNELKNDLEEAELDLEESKLEYIADYVEIIDDIADDYYSIFQLAYTTTIQKRQLEFLHGISQIAQRLASLDSTRDIDQIQMELEIANVQENLSENRSQLRIELADMKQRLCIEEKDSLWIAPEIKINPVQVDLDHAITNASTISPTLRKLEIDTRISEIDVQNEKGRNAFNVGFEVTYGMEKKDEKMQNMRDAYDNSNSVILKAYIPIWDWGQRKARVMAM